MQARWSGGLCSAFLACGRVVGLAPASPDWERHPHRAAVTGSWSGSRLWKDFVEVNLPRQIKRDTNNVLLSQAIGAVAGAYMVQHLEPHNLQFAIATSLLVVFILMVCPLAKLLKHFQDAQARRQGAREPLLPSSSPEGETLLRQPHSVLSLHYLAHLDSALEYCGLQRVAWGVP